MRILTYGLVSLFSLPILVLGIYLFLGLYDGIDTIHTFMQDNFLTVFKHSIILSFLSAILPLVIGIVLAKSFYTLQNHILKLLYLLVLTVLFMIQPIMILTVAKQITLFGTLNALSQSIIIATSHLIPLATLFWITIYRYTQTEPMHIAHYISSSLWSTYRYILFPQIRYKIVLAFLFLFILVFIDQEVPSILGYRTYTEELVSQMTLMENMQTIVLSALPSFFLVGTLTLGILIWFKKNILDFSNIVPFPKTSPESFGKIMLGILYLFLGFILYVLIKTLLHLSMETLFVSNTEIIVQTLVFSFFVSFFTLAVGVFLQYLLQYHSSRIVHIIWISLLLFYLLLPHSLVSLALLDIYQKIGLFSPECDFILFFVGYMLVLLPIASLLLYLFSITQKKDYFLDFFPLSRYHRWTKIILPKQWAVWTIVFLILMTFALNELSVSILLVPPGFETMIVRIYNLLHYGDKANIAFLSLVQLLFLMGCFVILSLLSKKVSK